MYLTYAFFISCALNITLIVYVAIISQKPKPKQKSESLELQEFLGDLLTGSSLVMVKRIASADVLLRSPRHK